MNITTSKTVFQKIKDDEEINIAEFNHILDLVLNCKLLPAFSQLEDNHYFTPKMVCLEYVWEDIQDVISNFYVGGPNKPGYKTRIKSIDDFKKKADNLFVEMIKLYSRSLSPHKLIRLSRHLEKKAFEKTQKG